MNHGCAVLAQQPSCFYTPNKPKVDKQIKENQRIWIIKVKTALQSSVCVRGLTSLSQRTASYLFRNLNRMKCWLLCKNLFRIVAAQHNVHVERIVVTLWEHLRIRVRTVSPKITKSKTKNDLQVRLTILSSKKDEESHKPEERDGAMESVKMTHHCDWNGTIPKMTETLAAIEIARVGVCKWSKKIL